MKQKLQIMFILILLGAAYGGYSIYSFRTEVYPQLEAERAAEERKANEKQAQLRQLQGFVQNIESIKKELKELSSSLDEALEFMPKTFNLSALLRRFNLLAQNSGVELQSFRPKNVEEKPSGAFYGTMQIDLQLRGTYSQTLVFLDQISRMKRIVSIDSVKVKPEASGTRSGGLLAVSALSLRTYRFVE